MLIFVVDMVNIFYARALSVMMEANKTSKYMLIWNTRPKIVNILPWLLFTAN